MSALNFVVVLFVAQILWAVAVRWSLKKIDCRREFSCRTAFEGESGELVEVVRNNGCVPIPWLRVESYISSGIRLGRQENLHVSSETFYSSCFTLMPYQQIRRRNYVRFMRRGVYDLGKATFTVGDLLGWTRFWGEQQLSSPVTVYPRIMEADELPFPLSENLGMLITKRQLLADPFMVRSIRPYQPGDLIRDIHWQATARTEEVQVRVHDTTVCPRLLVVINAQGTDEQWDNYVHEAFAPVLEEQIRLAASMCVLGLRSGLSAGFAVNMPRKRNGDSTILLPKEGTAWEEMLLEAFAQLQSHCSEKFIALLESLQTCRDMDILVISAYSSKGMEQAMDKLRQSGNQVTFYNMEGGGQ